MTSVSTNMMQETGAVSSIVVEELADKVRGLAYKQIAASDLQDRSEIQWLFVEVAQKVFAEYKLKEHVHISQKQQSALLKDIVDFATGQRVINYVQKLVNVSDVFLNGTRNTIVVYRDGTREITDPLFDDLAAMNTWLTNLQMTLGMHGSSFDPHHPSFNTRLPSGIRVNATHTSNTTYSVSLRIPNRDLRTLNDLYNNGTINETARDFLVAAVDAKLNIIIAGGTGAGKTALMLCMLGHLPKLERVVTIEDSLELDLEIVHPHIDVCEFEYLAPNTDGFGEVTTRQRLANALRMYPDRIVVGEVRDEIAVELLQAMATGNDGTLSTIHARSPKTIMDRLIDCSGQTPAKVHEAVRNSVDLFIHLTKTGNGERRITEIAQVTEQRGPNDHLTLEPLFTRGGEVTSSSDGHPAYVSTPSGEVLNRLRNVGWRP